MNAYVNAKMNVEYANAELTKTGYALKLTSQDSNADRFQFSPWRSSSAITLGEVSAEAAKAIEKGTAYMAVHAYIGHKNDVCLSGAGNPAEECRNQWKWYTWKVSNSNTGSFTFESKDASGGAIWIDEIKLVDIQNKGLVAGDCRIFYKGIEATEISGEEPGEAVVRLYNQSDSIIRGDVLTALLDESGSVVWAFYGEGGIEILPFTEEEYICKIPKGQRASGIRFLFVDHINQIRPLTQKLDIMYEAAGR